VIEAMASQNAELRMQADSRVHTVDLDPFTFLGRSAFVFREKTAVIDGVRRFTYPQILDRVNRLASALQTAGIRWGDRVAVLSPNALMPLEATFAIPRAGGIVCALNTRLAPEELDDILDHCKAKMLLYDAELDPVVERLATSQTRVRVSATDGQQPGALDYEAWLRGSDPSVLAPNTPAEDDTIAINYTSGTTGRPKGAMYTYRGVYLNALSEVFHAQLTADSVYLWTLPMFHCSGWCFPWAVTAAGATHVTVRKVEPASINAAIQHDGVTHFCAAPTVLVGLANAPDTVPFPRPITITTAGASPSPTTIGQIESLNATINHVYGLTEVYGPITACVWKSPHWDTLGAEERARLKSRQGVPMITVGSEDVRVVDEAMIDVPADGETAGEVVMRGNNVMKGYYLNPDATARAFASGWFHSGDVAVVHPDGYLEITDRAKDVIISGGENISTQQVEKVLISHDAVLEVAVIAIPDAKWGEVPKAFVTLKPGRSVDADELVAHARRHLAGFKVPKIFAFGELPKTSTGKIQKYILREREWSGHAKRVN
jgi:fatty-acyl-CoA synthase